MNPEHAYELPPIEGIDKEYAIEKLSRSYQNFCFKVRVPNIDEQKTIANYFENIDKLITSYNDELEKLKTIKKSLLEKMFV